MPSILAAMSTCWATALLFSTLGGVAGDRWAIVRSILEGYFPMQNLAFSAGDASGRKFAFQKGRTAMADQMPVASSSKLPAALAIVGSVADGRLSLDTFAHEVWPWWTADPLDRRSRVTLRRLLSFTSGFSAPDGGDSPPCLVSAIGSSYTSEACAREIYEQVPFEFEPGSTWVYSSFHLQVAGAMAASAANLSVQELLHRYLIGPLNLTSTYWTGGDNPILAGSLVITGNDYDKVLHAYLAYSVIPKELADEMERDYLEPPVQIADSSATLVKLLGHYSMCTFFECVPPKLAAFTPACKKANIHADPGLFGYYPLVDRARGTYMQVVHLGQVHSSVDYFAPTMAAMVLRRLVKGFVENALTMPESLAQVPESLAQVGDGDDAAWLPRAIEEATWEVIRHGQVATGYRSPSELWSRLTDEPELLA
mmetsp:Transcript_100767/g.280686  ORF Transcript_100767/g.280686 Transcript_100767/m.280686 type:complete len:425 (+) Transcript_100767:67-1341(+)|eukprot:CAMPEP_0179077192 /NCGR_PEP_ID=MMETSP0796-20121207/34488_1 /TAXON_ID=73915 /ORGANISM="Pyrodinium bahamense, Strain pbaha01" /LENGTH=424 /DNA_ID=CAMNT_0020774465 /DNA_START=60 /DNA_END=1334 /DNA_ORIENTATION=-